MENVAPILGFIMVVTFIGGIIAAVVAMAAAQNKKTNEVYGALARKYGGRLHEANWFSRPSVTFDHNGTWVRVDIYSTGGKNPTYYTQVHMGWPEPNFRMQVYPEGFMQRMGKTFLGMSDIEIGAPEFDRDYIITGNDLGMLRGTLNPRARMAINALRALKGNRSIYVAVRNYQLLVKKLGLIRDLATLNRLVELSLMLYDAALEEQEKGIQFLDSPSTEQQLEMGEPAEAAVCQICGDGIESDLVYCRGCKTPHHHDCWQYYGKCSTFGCGQRECYRPRKRPKSKRKV